VRTEHPFVACRLPIPIGELPTAVEPLKVPSKRIQCQRSDLELLVLPLLRGRVFHITQGARFDDIIRHGSIDSTRAGLLMPFIGRSKEGYGSKRGWVSLFDLSAPYDTDIRETLLRYYFFKAFRQNAEICILFITPNAWSSLISWRRARREVAGKELYVPFVEAWYPAHIPLSLITDGLMVRVQADS
jgi:hypothetical protein